MVQSIDIDITPLPPSKGTLPILEKHIYNYINFASPIFKRLKERKLERYVKQYSTAPAQGTQEWLEGRKKTIGGSEIATVIGQNNYCSYSNWIAEKVGLAENPFEGNTATRFGKLFENVSARLIELIFNTKIYNVGGIEDKYAGIKYSPDGLALIKYACFDTILNKPVETVEYLITLLEFKSPLTTIPNGKIPKHYIPQIMTGLTTLNVETGLFVNNMFRKCSLEQFKPNLNYDTKFHHKDNSVVGIFEQLTVPNAMGIIYFYCKIERYNDIMSKLHMNFVLNDQSIAAYNDNTRCAIAISSLSSIELDCIVDLSQNNSDSCDSQMQHVDQLDSTSDDLTESNYSKSSSVASSLLTAPRTTTNYNQFDSSTPDTQSVFDSSAPDTFYVFDSSAPDTFHVFDKLIDFGDKTANFETLLNLYVKDEIIAIIDDPYMDKKRIFKLPLLAAQKEILKEKKQWDSSSICARTYKDLPYEYSHINEIASDKLPNADYRCVGFLPWKLLLSDIISVEKDQNYLSPYEEKIKTTISILNQINKLSNRNLKLMKYNELFTTTSSNTFHNILSSK